MNEFDPLSRNPESLQRESSQPESPLEESQPDELPRPRAERLEFTPLVWIALLVIGLLGIRHWVEGPTGSSVLSYLDAEDPPIVRFRDQRRQFPILGVEVELSRGWVYLSVAADHQAFAPTFVHTASQSIVRLEPFRFKSWPLRDLDVDIEEDGDTRIEWVEWDHRRIGRLHQPPVDVALLVVTHRPRGRLNQEVRDFCRGIRVIPAMDHSAR